MIYNCKWWFGEILISLSVYGGVRTSPQGESAAGLYFDWMNEQSAAAPLMANYLETEAKLSQNIAEISSYSTSTNQQPYHRSHYELEKPHHSLKDNNLRAYQMALYTDQLFRTPLDLNKRTEEKTIGVFLSNDKETYCVYHKWDFAPISEDSKLEFVNILPARGGGGKELRINSLVLKDYPESNVLMDLKSKLEELTKVKFTYIEAYDD